MKVVTYYFSNGDYVHSLCGKWSAAQKKMEERERNAKIIKIVERKI